LFISQAPKSDSKDYFDDDDDFNFPLLDEEPPAADRVFSYKEVLEDTQYPSASSTPVKVTISLFSFILIAKYLLLSKVNFLIVSNTIA
jgi:hypothetical protein